MVKERQDGAATDLSITATELERWPICGQFQALLRGVPLYGCMTRDRAGASTARGPRAARSSSARDLGVGV